jgi:FkbM family methyltransferase
MRKIKALTPFRQLIQIYSSFLSATSTLNSIDRNLFGLQQDLYQLQKSVKKISEKIEETHRSSVPSSNVALYDRFGFVFALDSTSFVDRMVIETNDWEGDRISFLTDLARRMYQGEPMVFFDLGSYWGIYSFLLSKTNFFDAIHAFDADKYNFAQLQANIFLNKMDDLMSGVHAAVSSANGHAKMMKSRTTPDGNRGASRLLHEEEKSDWVTVQKVALDNLYDYTGRQIVVKMDVEGHEEEALTGMRRLIENNEIILQIEIYKEQTTKVTQALESLGLRRIGAMYPDFFYTNLPPSRIGI